MGSHKRGASLHISTSGHQAYLVQRGSSCPPLYRHSRAALGPKSSSGQPALLPLGGLETRFVFPLSRGCFLGTGHSGLCQRHTWSLTPAGCKGAGPWPFPHPVALLGHVSTGPSGFAKSKGWRCSRHSKIGQAHVHECMAALSSLPSAVVAKSIPLQRGCRSKAPRPPDGLGMAVVTSGARNVHGPRRFLL